MRRFVGILLGMFAIGVMQLILATAMPLIVTEIGGESLYSWVFSSYMLASLLTIPIFSKLADIYGKNRFYILGMGIFALGTLYGGFAPNMPQLIAARTIQGLSAGIITPVSLAMITDMFPPEKRGRMIGTFGFVQLLSNLLSPLLGGFISKNLGWHWIFFITLVMIIGSMLLAGMGGSQAQSRAKTGLSEIDFAGGLLFGGFCVLLVGFSKIISTHGYSAIAASVILALSLIAAAVLFLYEKRHKNPIIKFDFFKTKIIRRSLISAVIAGAIMYGLITVLPLCGVVLNKRGFKIDESRILFYFMIGITIGILGSSRIPVKFKSVIFARILWAAMSASSLLILYSISTGNLLMLNLFNMLIGLCVGGTMATFLINSQNAVSDEDRTVLSGLIQLGRYMGASVGVTVLTGVLPEIDLISSGTQIIGAFIALAVMCMLGLVNEII